MKDLFGAIEEEKSHLADKFNNIDSNLKDRLKPYGYESIKEYFDEKREYLFSQWKPEVYRIPIEVLSLELENAIINKKYGIYMPVTDSLYAFHGNDYIDYELCKNLGVKVVDLNYQGGTIIGSDNDLSIELIMPTSLNMESNVIITKIHEILSKYLPNVAISGNDILLDNKKIMGSMTRNIGEVFVWAAQISFDNYNGIIKEVCNKKSNKTPSFINSDVLSKSVLESEILQWLQKQ